MDNAPDQTTETTPPPAPAPVMPDAKKGPSYGAILGIILIVAVLVVGAFYMWGERLKENEMIVPDNGVRDGAPSDGMMQGSAGASVEIDASGAQPQ